MLFVLNREGGRVLIKHAWTPAEAKACFEKLRQRQPKLVLALSEQGTGTKLLAFHKKFKQYRLKPGLFAASPEVLAHINNGGESQDKKPVDLIEPSTAN